MFGLKKHTAFDLEGIDKGHHQVTYKGIKAIKCPFDYVLYQMIVTEVQPDIILEIGTNQGGTTLYLADLLELNNKGVVHSIDLPENKESSLLAAHSRVQLFRNGFQQYDTTLLEGKKLLVIEDGSHQYEDCLAALHRFAPYVAPGSYFIVEDGIVDALGRSKEFNGGPVRAIHEFLKGNNQYIIDRKWCDFFGTNATFNTDGYLKRIS